VTPRRPRRHWPWLVGLFLFGWLSGALTTLPLAAVVDPLDLPEGARLESPRGTVWNGRVTAHWLDRPPVDIDLRFRPAALFRAALAWEIAGQSTGLDGQARLHLPINLRPGRTIDVTAASLEADMDSPWTRALSPSLPLTGRLHLQAEDWQFGPQLESGRWHLDWHDAGVSLGEEVSLGTIEAIGHIADGKLQGSIQSGADNASSLPRVDLDIRQDTEGTLLVEGKVDPRGNKHVENLLTGIGTATDDGLISIRQRISFP
jgi:hypothetical protein